MALRSARAGTLPTAGRYARAGGAKGKSAVLLPHAIGGAGRSRCAERSSGLSRWRKGDPVIPARRAGGRYGDHNRSCPARFGKIAVWRPSRGYRFDAGLQPQLPFGSGAVALSGDAITPRPTPLRYAQKKPPQNGGKCLHG